MKTKRLIAVTLCILLTLSVFTPLALFAAGPKLKYSVGDTLEFGSYPQSKVEDATLISQLDAIAHAANGDLELAGVKYRKGTDAGGTGTAYYKYEPIVWRVLEQSGDEIFVVSDKNLTAGLRFDDDSNEWDNSEIRMWLNNVFITDAFTQNESEALVTKAPGKVFLLSIDEVLNPDYGFADNSDRVAVNTAYTASFIGMRDAGTADVWWLRSPDAFSYFVFCVSGGGIIGDDLAVDVRDSGYGVRPALRFDLTSAFYPDMPQYSAGDTLEFGSYPQSKVTNADLITQLDALTPAANGDLMLGGAKYRKGTDAGGEGTAYYKYEPIVWRVLERNGGELFVLSDKNLTSGVRFDDNSNNWETSEIRTWLNNTFITEAFAPKESAALATSSLDTYQYNSTDVLCTTQDRAFLLSYEESQALVSSSGRIALNTAYTASFFSTNVAGEADWWWLRDPGSQNYAGCYNIYGYYVSTCFVGTLNNGVRPALKLDLTSSIFADIPQYSFGDTLEFGSYPQSKVEDAALIAELDAINPDKTILDADLEFGGAKYRYSKGTSGSGTAYYKYEPIVWRVLEQNGGELFVVADKILKSGMNFRVNEDDDDVNNNWEVSGIRTYLNNSFFTDAFNPRESEAVTQSTITVNKYNSNEVLCTTQDRVFLLSFADATNAAYGFPTNTSWSDSRKAVTTAYSANVPGIQYVGEAEYWWLLSPASEESNVRAHAVYPSGIVGAMGGGGRLGLRPAMRLNLTSSVFSDMPEYSTGDTIEFGSYPKSLVTDADLIAELDALTPDIKGNLEFGGKRYHKNNRFDYDKRSFVPAYYLCEPIVWRVLEQSNGELFVLSDKAITTGVYREGKVWASDGLRAWLNRAFIDDAFTEAESACVATSKLNTYELYTTNLLCTTMDRVFLLSAEEAFNADYGFSSDADRVAVNTEFAARSFEAYAAGSASYWNLRAAGVFIPCVVSPGGDVGTEPDMFNRAGKIGLRPAMRLNLTSPLLQKSAPEAADFTLSGNNATYTARENPVTVTPAADMGEITVYYEGIAPSVYAKSTTPPTNAGRYAITVSVAGNKEFISDSGIEVGILTVSKATPEYEPPTDLSAVYGDLLSSVELTDGFAWDAQYGTGATVGNTGENTFNATFTPEDTTNYNTINDIPLEIAVGKATPEYTVPVNLTATYGDLLSSIELTEGFAWDAQYGADTTVGNAGSNTFLADFTPADMDNYNAINDIAVQITVAKVNPIVQTPAATATGKSNLTLADVALPDGWAWNNSAQTAVNGAAYAATFTPADTLNYNSVSANITVTVIECTHEAWGEWTSNGDATFFTDGTKTRTCENCGETETETDEGSAGYNSFFKECFGETLGSILIKIFGLFIELISWCRSIFC